MKRKFVVLCMVMFVACCVACGGANPAPTNSSPVEAFTLDKIIADHKSDWKTAQKKYKNTVLTFEATVHVAKAHTDKADGFYTVSNIAGEHVLASNFDRTDANEKAVLSLKKGDVVKIKGRMTSGSSDKGIVTLGTDDSSIVK